VQVETLFLVWNADAGLRGGLKYAAHRLRGNHPCTLCDLTYGLVTAKPEWNACARELGAPWLGLYRDRLDGEQARIVDGDFPCVLARTPAGLVKLVDSASIKSCDGDLDRFVERLRAAIAAN
jgi:hypothetical protein